MGRIRKQDPISKDYEEFGAKIKQLRIEKGLTQEELAKLLGISKTSVVNYETGTRKIPLTLIIEFANFFEVSVDDLLGIDLNDNSKEEANHGNSISKINEEQGVYIHKVEVVKEKGFNIEQIEHSYQIWDNALGFQAFTDDEIQELIEHARYILYKRTQNNN